MHKYSPYYIAIFAASLIWSRFGYAQPPNQRTYVIRRSGRVHDVTIDDDVESQIKLWNGLRDRTFDRLAEYLETGRSYRSYMANFLHRYRPDGIHEQLVTAFEQCSHNDAKRARAAWLLIQFDDYRGVEWALSRAHAPADETGKQEIMRVFGWLFRHEETYKLPPRRLQLTPALEHLIENIASPKTISKWIARLEGESGKSYARRLAMERNDSYGGRILKEQAKIASDNSILNFLQSTSVLTAETDANRRTRYAYQQVIQQLCHNDDKEIRNAATAMYEDYIRSSSSPIYSCVTAIGAGVELPDSFLDEIRETLRSSVAADIESARELSLKKQAKAGWAKYRESELAYMFAGTQDEQIIQELENRIDRNLKNGKSQATNLDELLAIEIVSGEAITTVELETLRGTKLAIPQMEFHCRLNDKSPKDLFRLFHDHGYPTELDAAMITRRLNAKRAASEYHAEMLTLPNQYCIYELAREVFREQNQWTYLSYERYLDSFWRMVDATNEEFAPDHFTVFEDDAQGGRTVGFTWNGKRYRFPFRSVIGFVPQLNAVLKDAGSKNGFVQFTGRPSGGFMTASTPKVAFGPVALLDALEKEFGMAVSFR